VVSTAASDAPVVELDLPQDFVQVPVDSDVRRRTAEQLQVVDALGISDPAQREALGLYLESLAVRLSRGDVSATTFCAVQLRGRPSTATLTVALQATHTADRGLVVLGAAEAFRREGRHQSVSTRTIGSHPAVVAVAEHANVNGGARSGDLDSTLRELSILVPVAGHEHAVVMTLATPCLEDWDVYERLMVEACRSLHVRPRSSLLIG
jgi:hypothetical protein